MNQVQKIAKQNNDLELKEITKLKLEFMEMMAVNKYDEAENLLEKILRIDPNNKTIKQFKLFLQTFKDSMKIIDKVDSQNQDQNEQEEEEYQEEQQQEEEDEQLKPEDEEALGYAYHDPQNTNYDDKLYQEQRKIFFEKLKEGDDIKTSLNKAQQITNKKTLTQQQTSKTQIKNISSNSMKTTANQKSTTKLTR